MPADLDHLQPDLRAALTSAGEDLRRQGIVLDSHITSGYRSYDRQAALYAERGSNPNPVARPGSSPHEFGRAVDISMVGWGPEQQQMVTDTLHRYGLSRPVAGDPVHWQLTSPGQAARPEQPPQQVFPRISVDYQPPAKSEAEERQYPTDGSMIPFASTMLSAAGYRLETQELLAEFVKTGRLYTYLGVPESVWRDLVDAGSKGQFMRGNVIGVYPFAG